MIADIVDEALRVHGAGQEREIPVRIMGGIAVQLHAPGGLPPSLTRTPKDIDLVVPKRAGKAVQELLESLGYEPNKRFNMMNSGRRALFYDLDNERQLDVFVGSFEMCHVIPIADRIELEPVTVPLAELLLTKMQIVQLNEKDQRDILALVHDHVVDDRDDETINGGYVARLCAADWGLWRTVKMNVERAREGIPAAGLDEDTGRRLDARLTALWARVDAEPKGARWKMRDRIGDRKRWYEEPDEVG
jgi:Uncharacterised nucleotidyltransferase